MSASARRRRRTNSNNSESESSAVSSRMQQQTDGAAAAVLPLSGVSTGPGSCGCRDRTLEFKTIVKTLQSSLQYSNQNGVNQIGGAGARSKKNGRQEFNHVAKLIAKDLSSTYAKLEKLTLLARRRSLFDDRGEEIERLTEIIRQDLTSLNTQISRLQDLSKTSQRQASIHEQTHSNTVVVSLQSKLASMSGNFKSVLEVRTENLKQQKSRREEFSSTAPRTTSLPTDSVSRAFGSVLLQDEASYRSDHTVVNMDNLSQQQQQHRQQQQQQLQLIDEQDSYILGRADTMANIEQTIVELGGIFQQLATMVHEQEELVQRIDSNVEESHSNIEAAHGELVRYFQSVTSNRWLMFKIFAVLIFFFIIFVVFLA